MTRFILTSNLNGNTLDLTYNHLGQLVEMRMDGEFDTEAHEKAFRNMPLTLEKYKSLKWTNTTIQEVPTDLSFIAFYNPYENKVDRIDAEKFWNKMNDTDKMGAIVGIPKYDRYLSVKGTSKLSPWRYLKRRVWEWEELKKTRAVSR